MWLRVFLTSTLVMALLGCVPPEPVSTLPVIHDHTAEHTERELIRESGYYGRDANSIVGLVALGYDDNFGPPDRPFRMALMIHTDDGRRIDDFFEEIPVEPGDRRIVGKGNARIPVPRVMSSHGDWWEGSRLLAEHFPDRIETDFELTFKEFTGHAYYLEDVPKGIAFIWFQTGFDGNRVTQAPLAIRLEPNPKAITRLDLRIGKTTKQLPFHTL